MLAIFVVTISLILVLAESISSIRWTATTQDLKLALTNKESLRFLPVIPSTNYTINVDQSIRYQSIYGIGSSLESSTAFNLMRLSSDERAVVLKKLFDVENGLGINLMRVTIGTSDFCPLPYYSYDDLDEGEVGKGDFFSDFFVA